MRKCAWSSLLLALTTACTGSLYGDLAPAPPSPTTLAALRPPLANVLYRAEVDVVGRQLSGLLLFKTLPDSVTRVVFTNEIGVKFFDFAFGPQASFKVVSCLEQLNKPAVLNQLRQDLGLLLLRPYQPAQGQVLRRANELYYRFPGEKGTQVYYITDAAHQQLLRIEQTTPRKLKTVVQLFEPHQQVPDSVFLEHKLYRFTISLKQLKR